MHTGKKCDDKRGKNKYKVLINVLTITVSSAGELWLELNVFRSNQSLYQNLISTVTFEQDRNTKCFIIEMGGRKTKMKK